MTEEEKEKVIRAREQFLKLVAGLKELKEIHKNLSAQKESLTKLLKSMDVVDKDLINEYLDKEKKDGSME